MTEDELTGAEAFEPGDQGKIIDKAAHIGARLPEPECGFDDRYDTCFGHRFIIVGCTRDHVCVRVDDHAGITSCAGRLLRTLIGVNEDTSLSQQLHLVKEAGEVLAPHQPVATSTGKCGAAEQLFKRT